MHEYLYWYLYATAHTELKTPLVGIIHLILPRPLYSSWTQAKQCQADIKILQNYFKNPFTPIT